MDKQKYPKITFLKRMAVSDATVDLEGREIINFSTYNYLGLAGDERVTSAAKAAIDQWGTSTGSGRSITGEIDLHQQFERELCDVIGAEDAVLSVGGYSTNTFAIGYLCRPKDVIFYDETYPQLGAFRMSTLRLASILLRSQRLRRARATSQNTTRKVRTCRDSGRRSLQHGRGYS